MASDKVFSEGWKDYELIDAGGGKKLERWGDIITIRPEVQAYFKSDLLFSEWNQMAHFEFVQGKGQSGKWKHLKPGTPTSWIISYGSLKFKLELTKFKHVGLFPEQNINWKTLSEKLNDESRFLNLFAYTGAASCVARNRGAETMHVDSVKQLISWAAENMELSRILNIKWVHDDALKFANRLVRREEQFDAIIMDPPAWGIGAKKEKWKLEDKLDELLGCASQILKTDGVLILNTYSPKVDIKLLSEMSDLYFADRDDVSVAELWMKTRTGKKLYYGNMLRVGISS
jgi:23S rRNA (cytosine1962-C5)-methyltransferase